MTARLTSRAGTKVGLSDLVVLHGKAITQRIKAEMGKVIEKNAELEIENQHLREHLHEIEQKLK